MDLIILVEMVELVYFKLLSLLDMFIHKPFPTHFCFKITFKCTHKKRSVLGQNMHF